MKAMNRQRGMRARRAISTWLSVAMALPLLLSATGCSYSPSFNILGSYFPSWIICCTGAAVATFAAHRVLMKRKMIAELWPQPVVYTALFCFVSCSLWLIFFR